MKLNYPILAQKVGFRSILEYNDSKFQPKCLRKSSSKGSLSDLMSLEQYKVVNNELRKSSSKLRKSYTSSIKQTLSEPTERHCTDTDKLSKGGRTRSHKAEIQLFACPNLNNNETNE